MRNACTRSRRSKVLQEPVAVFEREATGTARSTREEARHRNQRRPRPSRNPADISLAPTARICLVAAFLVVMCLCMVWGMTAVYQRGYVEGYEDAKAVYHG